MKRKNLILITSACLLTLFIVYRLFQNERILKIKLISNEQTKSAQKFFRNDRFLICERQNGQGYGNNLYKMISCFMVALITESKLLVVFKEVDQLIRPPEEILYNVNESLVIKNITSESVYRFKYLTDNLFSPERKLLLNISVPVGYNIYYVDDIYAYFFDLCSNPAYFDKLVEYKFVKKQTIQKAKSSLNEPEISERQKIENFLMIGFEFAGSVLNNYWTLSEYMKGKIRAYYQTYFKDVFVIGMQFRFHYLDESDVTKFMNCAVFIEKSILNETTKPIKWYVSSDDENFVEKFKSTYKEKILNGEGKIGHTSDPNAYERAIFDIEMLSLCNELIFTGGSTFGFISAMKSQRLPYYVNGRSTTMDKCQKMKLSFPSVNPWNVAVY